MIYQDTVASLYQRNSIIDLISKAAKNIFIPLTVGGGIRSIEDIKCILNAGADKVSINTAATENPKLISEASKVFGSSTIVIAIEAIKQKDGTYLAYTDNGREHTGLEVTKWVKEVADRGAGEILLTSIDNEGTGKGFDLNLIKQVTSIVDIPVIAHGGAGNAEHICETLNIGADAICISSILHYSVIKDNKVVKYNFEEGNTEFLAKNQSYKAFGNMSLIEIKQFLKNENIPVRGIE